jgi:cell division protein ZapA (FtsZ GTPase activity inhibitor)
MNENTSRIVEYVLVILIGLIVSYVVFAQQQSNKDKFIQLEEKITTIEQRLDSLKADNTVEDLKLKALDEKVNPKVEATTPTEEGKTTTTEEGKTTTPTTSQPKITPTAK